MYEQGYITHEQYDEGRQQALPAPDDIEPPRDSTPRRPTSPPGCASSWSTRYGAAQGLLRRPKVKSTLDLDLQDAAEEAVNSYLGYSPPTASVVVIDNHNAGVKAMVGGPDFETKPFNLATQGHRQPGSSIKPFTLVTALEQGISPYTIYESAPQDFHFGKKRQGKLRGHQLRGHLPRLLRHRLRRRPYSDNSIYAQLGLEG